MCLVAEPLSAYPDAYTSYRSSTLMRHHYPLPMGAELLPQGGARFRLWAPGAKQVTLCLATPGGERETPMQAEVEGWHSLDLFEAGAGNRYRFRIDGGLRVPDPASRYNPEDVHAASQIMDPAEFDWQDTAWRGRAWAEAVIYELHVGTFTPEGTFRAAMERLDYLAGLGITAIELMPLADFPGRHDWGYDGVLLFAPDAAYGTPDDLKAFIQAAHARGLMVLLDVVYNHFGPEGNYLHVYAPQFFSPDEHTPWGAAIDLGKPVVRDFFIHNALYWITEFRFDGLRLDAIHAMPARSRLTFLAELAHAVRGGPGRDRLVHLVLENDANESKYLGDGFNGIVNDVVSRGVRPTTAVEAPANVPNPIRAQWNDDWHHTMHVLLTGETDGYYADFAADPTAQLARCLAEGFAWQGEASPFRDGERRGEPSWQLPAAGFVAFLNNHDQVGNRALGERLNQLARPQALKAALATLLLSPQPPLLFMGEEFGAATPFLFFCDFGPDLREPVRDGRRKEFARFERFSDPAAQAAIPDPCALETFLASKLDWSCLEREPHRAHLDYVRQLLQLRAWELNHRLAGTRHQEAQRLAPGALRAVWRMGDGSTLSLLLNLSRETVEGVARPAGRCIHECDLEASQAIGAGRLPGESAVWFLD